MENIAHLYGKHKISEILNCDMIKVLEQDFKEKNIQISIKNYF